ncbi:terminase [Corynebacterium phoceense]|uniref:Terminase n=2 Tax=Corynebacterium phoceense TaxID=1686286 RepID=A0A540R758_9CORY|nr:terminase [Corynebacterium phoceense]
MDLSRLSAEAERIRAGRELSEFDLSVVETVAGLTLRLQDAREAIEREGTIIDDGKGFPVEHPALMIEKRASAELRGWVKDRPDLFGEQKGAERPRREKFGGFKVV